MRSDYDVFISYRRDGGAETALYLRHVLHERGYRVFFDMEALRSGPFDTRLYSVIEGCTDVIVVLSPGCFDRCRNEGDWFRLEIAHALKCGTNIVPFSMRQFNYDEMSVLPEDIASLKQHNGVSASYEYNDATLEKLTGFLKCRPTRVRRRGNLHRAIIGSVAVCLALLFAVSLLMNREESAWPPMQPMDLPSAAVATTSVMPSIPEKEQEPAPEEVLLSLYTVHSASWANGSIESPANSKDQDVVFRYFAPELGKRLIGDQTVWGIHDNDIQEIALDFDILYDAQDASITEFYIAPSVVTGDKARVDVHFKNFGDPTKLVFRMGHTPDGWRVEDIEYRNHTSLLKLLTSE